MQTQFMTVGFMFSEDLTKVALIKKLRPEWQKNMLNGVGGKVNEGESFLLAQIREFFEETGIVHFNWTHVGEVTVKLQDPMNPISASEGSQVQFYATKTDKVFSVQTREDEEVEVYDVNEVLNDGSTITNLNFLIPHAIAMLEIKPEDDMPL